MGNDQTDKDKSIHSSTNHSDNEDIYQTIEFTEEDKQWLREPNRQPVDQDYFAKSIMQDTPKESPNKYDFIESDKEQPASEAETEFVESQPQSKPKQDQKIQDGKPIVRESKPKKKLDSLFKPTYEDHYDLNELEDITEYNQFTSEEEEEEAVQSRPSFFSNIKQAFTKSELETGEDDLSDILEVENNDEQFTAEDDKASGEGNKTASIIASMKKMFFGSDKSDEASADDELELYEDSSEFQLSETTGDELSEINPEMFSDVSADGCAGSESDLEEKELVQIAGAIEVEELETDYQEVEEEEQHVDQKSDELDHAEGIQLAASESDEEFTDLEIREISEKISQDTASFSEPILTDQAIKEALSHDKLKVEKSEFQEYLSEEDDKKNLVSGASWLTAGNVISRIIGALYVIPWATWLGEGYTEANTLYSVGYKNYSLFLAISTAGFPSSIAKQMAYYHSKKEYKTADKLFKYSMLIMLATGLISSGIFFLLAPTLAANTATTNTAGATLVIRSLAPALLILPMMSLLRGYFQGFNDMKPTAISQIIEQFARVGYLLAATYAIMVMYNGEVTQAVVHSTFAAFIGALGSLLYLVFIYVRQLPLINRLKETSLNRINLDFKESIKIMVVDSIPFILLGSGIVIAQLIDTYTFRQILQRTSSLLLSEISQMYGTLSLDVDKLVMIIISLAVAIASSLVPTITKYYASRNITGTSELVEHIVTLFSFIMIPAALGMASISNNIYFLFYPYGLSIGPSLLITGSISSIVLGAYTVFSTILQSMNYRRLAVRFLVVGLLIKVILQYPLIALLHGHGALLSTMFGFLISSILMWVKLHRALEIDYRVLNTNLLKISIGSVLMAISATMWNETLNLAFGEVGRLLTFVKILIVVVMAVVVYGSVMGVTNMLSVILGDKYKDLQDKMRVM